MLQTKQHCCQIGKRASATLSDAARLQRRHTADLHKEMFDFTEFMTQFITAFISC